MQPSLRSPDARRFGLVLGLLLMLVCVNGVFLVRGLFTGFGPWPSLDVSSDGRFPLLLLAPAGAICLASAVLGHEWAHCLAGRACGLRDGRISFRVGAALRPHYSAPPQSAWQDPHVRFRVFIAGPVFDQLFVAATLLLLYLGGRWANLLATVAFAAYALGVFNLMAVARTDLRQALDAVAEATSKSRGDAVLRFILGRWNRLLLPCYASILGAGVLGSITYVRWTLDAVA